MADSLLEKTTYLDKPRRGDVARPSPAARLRWLNLALPLAVLLVALLPRLLNLDTFITADEDDQIMFATHFLKSILRGDWGGALVLGYPGVPTLFLGAAGVALRYGFHYAGWLPLSWVTADFMTTMDQVTARFGVFEYPLDFLVWVRVPMALAAAFSILGIYLLARRLVDGRVALVGTLIIAFDPFILAHSRVIHVDAPLSYFMFLSFLAFLLYLDQGAWKWLILSGLFGGLAGLSKTPAALLGPILVVSGALYAIYSPPGLGRGVRWKRLGVALLVWGLIAVAAIFALWPTMWSQPLFAIQSLICNINSVGAGYHPTTGIFWSDQQTDQNPFYYLIVLPYHLTPLTTVGLLTSLGLIGAGLIAYRRRLDTWSARMLPLALGLVAYGVIFMMPVSTIARRGDRYILPVFFAVGLLSALALGGLVRWLRRLWPADVTAPGRFGPAYLLAGAVLIQIVMVLFYHPYYLAYFNPLLGGYRTAPDRVNIGWGEGLDLAAAYLNELTADNPTDRPQVAAWYSNQFAPYYQGPTVDLSNQEAALTADYTVFYINQIQRGFPSREILHYFRQRQPLHVVKLGGIEYAWIYKGPVIGQELQSDFVFPAETVLADGARLYGVDVPVREMPADAFAVAPGPNAWDGPYLGYQDQLLGLPVTLYWETVGAIHTNHGKTNAYIRLVDEEGHSWGQVDRLILAGLWRTNRWHPGYFLRDEYKLPIDPATPPGTYHLEVGLYDFETNRTLGVAKNIGQLTLTPPERLPPSSALKLETRLAEPVNQQLTLVGHTYGSATLPPGAEIAGKIFWQADQRLAQDYNLEFSFISADRKKYVVAEKPLSSYSPRDWRRGEIVGEAYRFRIPAVTPPGTYPITVTVIEPESGQPVGQPIALTEIKVEALQRNFELPEDVTPISAVLNNEIELVGYRLHDKILQRRESLGLTLYWRSLKFADSNYTVFVHAAGPDQVIRGQWDSVPVQGTAPTGGWIPGEIIEDHYEVLMGRDVPPWKYDIFVGMYDPVTGKRLPVYSETAPVTDDRIWLTRLQAVE